MLSSIEIHISKILIKFHLLIHSIITHFQVKSAKFHDPLSLALQTLTCKYRHQIFSR